MFWRIRTGLISRWEVSDYVDRAYTVAKPNALVEVHRMYFLSRQSTNMYTEKHVSHVLYKNVEGMKRYYQYYCTNDVFYTRNIAFAIMHYVVFPFDLIETDWKTAGNFPWAILNWYSCIFQLTEVKAKYNNDFYLQECYFLTYISPCRRF